MAPSRCGSGSRLKNASPIEVDQIVLRASERERAELSGRPELVLIRWWRTCTALPISGEDRAGRGGTGVRCRSQSLRLCGHRQPRDFMRYRNPRGERAHLDAERLPAVPATKSYSHRTAFPRPPLESCYRRPAAPDPRVRRQPRSESGAPLPRRRFGHRQLRRHVLR